MKVALTADWLVTQGGAERVIAQMISVWPDAPLFTTVAKENCIQPFPKKLHTSNLQKWFALTKNHRLLLPWMPRAVESWDLSGFDVIVSSSHAVAKGCIPPVTARHICYCHTPIRYAWEMEQKYLDDFGLKGLPRSLVQWQLKKIRQWDRTTAKRVDLFIANSRTTQERIKRYYGRESIVLHPPVGDIFFQAIENGAATQEPYFLTVGRLVPYKRTDVLIKLANEEKFHLKIAGSGPEEKRLRALAGDTVEFLGYVQEEELPALYAGAQAFLFPAEEDAGIVPLEAQACGTPVIAYGKGGALDTVKQNETGIFFSEQTVESLGHALSQLRSHNFDRTHIREHAAQFSSAHFQEKLLHIVEGEMGNRKGETGRGDKNVSC